MQQRCRKSEQYRCLSGISLRLRQKANRASRMRSEPAAVTSTAGVFYRLLNLRKTTRCQVRLLVNGGDAVLHRCIYINALGCPCLAAAINIPTRIRLLPCHTPSARRWIRSPPLPSALDAGLYASVASSNLALPPTQSSSIDESGSGQELPDPRGRPDGGTFARDLVSRPATTLPNQVCRRPDGHIAPRRTLGEMTISK